MKLILTQEVDGLGSAGDVVDVKDGYGRNYLVPRGFAVRWTRGGEKTVESIKTARGARAVRDEAHATEIKAALEGTAVSVKVRAGDQGRLFGAVTATEIAEAIAEQTGQPVDRRTI
ncbi:MAG TPA: 50S ribosomal protein L9, partial [Nocardioides sp.]